MVITIDKNTDVLDCYRDLYKNLGLSSAEFANTPEAYDFFIKNHMDIRLITTELSLTHKFDGLAFAQDIKKISSLPIILITGDSVSAIRIENSPFSAVLIKPIKPETLIKQVVFWYALKI